MIYTKWSVCVCRDCGKKFDSPLDGEGKSAFGHQECADALSADDLTTLDILEKEATA